MELLAMPGFGLDERRFNFSIEPDRSMEILAVEDIGKFVAAIFADPARPGGRARDAVTGRDPEALFADMLDGRTNDLDLRQATGGVQLLAQRTPNPQRRELDRWGSRLLL